MTEKPSPNIKKRVLGRCSRRNFPNTISLHRKLLLFDAEYLGLLEDIILMP